MKVRLYRSASGRRVVADYILGLPASRREEVIAALRDLEANGVTGSALDLRQIEGKLWEVKLASDRLFYVLVDGPELIVLHGYKKQSQKAPRREIATAERRLREVLGG